MGKYIAVTGGIGSGKSTAISIIEKRGYPVFSCDEIYKEVLQDKEYIETIDGIFDGVVKKGVVDKTALGKRVFGNAAMRKRLESIAHPLIMKKLFSKMRACNAPLVFAEVPLLLEGGYEKDFDGVLVLLRDLQDRIAAIRQRDGGNADNARQKIAAQFDYDREENLKRLQGENITLVHNDGTPQDLQQKIHGYLDTLEK